MTILVDCYFNFSSQYMTSEVKNSESAIEISPAIISEMIKEGVHIGKVKSRSHPKMKGFIFGTRQNLQIIDLEKTVQKLSIATEFAKNIVKNNGTILFVGTKMPSKSLVMGAAVKCNMPYVSERWLGGTLTNINTILKRIEYFLDIEKKKATGELAKYTKKEQLGFEKEIRDLSKNLEGLRNFKKLPEAIFIIDAAAHEWVVNEANKMKVPIISIVDTDANPIKVNYPIPANASSLGSVKLILDKMTEAITSNK